MLILRKNPTYDKTIVKSDIFKIKDANAIFLKDNEISKKLTLPYAILASFNGFQLSNAFDFFNLVERYHTSKKETAFSFYKEVIDGLRHFGNEEYAKVFENYVTLVKNTTVYEIEYDPDDSIKAKSSSVQSKLDELNVEANKISNSIDIKQLVSKIYTELDAKLVNQDEFDEYWINQIVLSKDYKEMAKIGRQQGMARKRRFEHWQIQDMRANDLEWQFDIWQAPMGNMDNHFYDFAQTNKGLVRLSSGQGMQKQLLIHSWPDLEILIDTREDRAPNLINQTEAKAAKAIINNMIAGTQKISSLNDKFSFAKSFSTIVKGFSPIAIWHIGYGLGNLGASNKMLVNAFLYAIFSIIVLFVTGYFITQSQIINSLIYGPYGILHTPLALLIVFLSINIICFSFWRIIMMFGLYIGTFKRALYGFSGSTNLPNTGHTNFIMKLFGKK